MTRPIPVRPFNAVVAPSKSRPQLSTADVRADLLAAKTLMGASGVAGFTEISHPGIKALFASVFGHRVGLKRSDCPIVWTADFTKVSGGVVRGVRGIPVVAPARPINRVHLLRVDGLAVGILAVHMHPGGWVQHPRGAQRVFRPLIRRLWRRHAVLIQRQINELVKTCDVVVVMGDINRPDAYTWHPIFRMTDPGLLYLGAWAKNEWTGVTAAHLHRQHADHPAAVVTITPKEHR